MNDLIKSNETEYNLYFSKIIYRKYYRPDNSYIEKCELHGDELEEDEVIEIKWNNQVIEKYNIHLVIEEIGWNKMHVPYIITKFNDTNTRICAGGLMARRLYEPKK